MCSHDTVFGATIQGMEIVRLREVGVEEAARQAARVLKDGGVVLFPTDTVYGLAVDAMNPEALARLRALKGRDEKKPISVIVPGIESLSRYGIMHDRAHELADRFLPGALTLVVEATKEIPAELTQDGAIGLRVPDDTFCLALAETFGTPYTATSANRSGLPTLGSVAAILEQFGDSAPMIDLVIDDGTRSGTEPSTIVAIRDGSVSVLREGAIPSETILS